MTATRKLHAATPRSRLWPSNTVRREVREQDIALCGIVPARTTTVDEDVECGRCKEIMRKKGVKR